MTFDFLDEKSKILKWVVVPDPFSSATGPHADPYSSLSSPENTDVAKGLKTNMEFL